jgi:hypothetical protein
MLFQIIQDTKIGVNKNMKYADKSGSVREVKNKMDILKSIRSLSFTPTKSMSEFKKTYAKRFEEVYGKKLNTKTDEDFLNDLIYYGEVVIVKPTRKSNKKIGSIKKNEVNPYYKKFL